MVFSIFNLYIKCCFVLFCFVLLIFFFPAKEMSLPITITPITGNTIDTVCIVLTGLSGLGILLTHAIIITEQIPIDRTRCPKISNTIHRWYPPRARRGRHSSHYDCHYYYQQYCHVAGESSGLLKRLHDYVQYTPTE